jgi:hypothetical protein
VGVAALLATLGAAAPAPASLKQDLQRFSQCPDTNHEVAKCVYGTTTSGEFVIGNSTVPITKTVTIQAGLERGSGNFVPALDGNTLSKTPLQVPGGLVGIELLGNFTEVTATAELAGTGSLGNGVFLPLKVKLDNLVLGGGCYIGSNTEPIKLNLIYGTTNPPPPNKPIKGESVFSLKDNGAILSIAGKLVDNAFAVPGANGCTLLPLVGDLAVNLKEGLPAAAGKNTAIMGGVTEEANAPLVRAVLALPDFGRCQKAEAVAEGKKLVPHGRFSNSNCTTTNEEYVGKYEWLPGPGAKSKFTGVGKALTLETVGGTSVTCTAHSYEGEYTGAKTETVAYKLTGCKKAKTVACQSASASPGEIRTATLDGTLDFIKENEPPEVPLVGVELKPASGASLMTFECGGESISVGGSAIAPITTVDKMASSFKLKPAASAGKQSPEEFEVGPKHTLTFGSSQEQAGLTTTDTTTNEEPIEVQGIG